MPRGHEDQEKQGRRELRLLKRELEQAKMAAQKGAKVVLGGPEPPYYAKEYLEHGADVQAPDTAGRTPLHLAVERGDAGGGDGVGHVSSSGGVSFFETA